MPGIAMVSAYMERRVSGIALTDGHISIPRYMLNDAFLRIWHMGTPLHIGLNIVEHGCIRPHLRRGTRLRFLGTPEFLGTSAVFSFILFAL